MSPEIFTPRFISIAPAVEHYHGIDTGKETDGQTEVLLCTTVTDAAYTAQIFL